MFTVDLLHEFELGVWKAIFTHLLRILYAHGDGKIQELNKQYDSLAVESCSSYYKLLTTFSVIVMFLPLVEILFENFQTMYLA